MGKQSASQAVAHGAVETAASRARKARQRAELELLQHAVGKLNRGEKLTAKEQRAIERYEAEQQLTAGQAFVRAVPKKLYEEWSGRQTKILHDQADLYGAPLRGATVDLVELVAWLHAWLADHKHELAIVAKGEASPSGGRRADLIAEQTEQLRKKNALLEAKLNATAGELVPREVCHALLARLAQILRRAGHTLHKIDPRAGAVHERALENFQELVQQFADGRLALAEDHDGPGGDGLEPAAA